MSRIYAIPCKSIQGKEESLANKKGKVLLIVNTASQCGFTPQFQGLEELYKKYHSQGLEILGFPCNQFGSQDPASNEEIFTFCQTNYGVTFPMFAKVDVNGSDAHPLYQWLRTQKGGVLGDRIKWNFTKFLIDGDGNVVKRYASTTKPEKITADIEAQLKG